MGAGENAAGIVKLLDSKDRRILLLFLLFFILIHFLFLNLTLSRRADGLFNDARHRLGPGTDFSAYYNAGKHWLAGEGMYGHGPGFGFRYHPAVAAGLFAPLSLLPETTAYAIWVFLLEIAFFSIFFFLFKIFKSSSDFFLSAIILACFSPYYLEAYMGNSTFLAAAILVWGFYFYRQDRLTPFAIALVVSILIKPIGLIFLPILLVRRQFKALVIIIGFTVATAIPFFLVSSRDFSIFTQINFNAIPAAGWVVHGGNQGFHCLIAGLCTRLSGLSTRVLDSFALLPLFCRLLLAIIPFLVGGIALWFSWLHRKKVEVLVFLWCAVYILGYKDVWEHTYTIMVLGLIFLAISQSISKKIVFIGSIWLALPTLFVIYDPALPPGPVDPEHYWTLGTALLHHGFKPAPVLLLFVATAIYLLKSRRPPHA